MAQQLENLCFYGIQCFPTPTDTLFAAKHRYLTWLLQSGIPIIPTVFVDPSSGTNDIKGAIKTLCKNADAPLNHVYLKRGVSESANCVWKLEANMKAITACIKDNPGNQGAFWFIQPPVAELEDQPEIKLFFTLHATFAFGFAQRRTGEKSVYQFEELRVDSRNWEQYRVSAAITFATRVYTVVALKAPSLGVVMRIDLVLMASGGFLVNEVEHFGNMWLLIQHSSIGGELMEKVVSAMYQYLLNS